MRNYQARNNLKAMVKGDYVYFYHSVTGKQIMGIAKVEKEFYPDPTIEDARWVVVDLKVEQPLVEQVTLDDIKRHPRLKNIALIKQSRLSVIPLSCEEFKIILKLAKTKLSNF